jgi:hypothetical protein
MRKNGRIDPGWMREFIAWFIAAMLFFKLMIDHLL